MVGWFWDGKTEHGFLRDARGRFTTIDYPGATMVTEASGINDHGEIVGGFRSADGWSHGFFRNAKGKFIPIDIPAANSTTPDGVNNAGDIVGGYQDATWTGHGFIATISAEER